MEIIDERLKNIIADDEEVAIVRRTSDYTKFKLLVGNRAVGEDRIKKIKESLETVGYVLNPVIVNERFEIIDGQGRFTTFREKKMPIDYIIAFGAGIDECISMNVNQSNWKLIDYVKSKADTGNESYIRLLDLVNKYPEASLDDIECAISGRLRACNDDIKLGIYTMTDDQYRGAKLRLNKVRELYNNLDLKALKSVGSIHHLIRVYIICLDFENIDMKRLDKVILKSIYNATPFKDELTCSNSISDIYDRGLADKKYINFLFKQRYDAVRSEKSKKNKGSVRYGSSMQYEDIDKIEFDFHNEIKDDVVDELKLNSTTVTKFLTDADTLNKLKNNSVMPLTDIHKMYYEFCVRNRIKPLSSKDLYTKLEQYGFKRGARATSSNPNNKDKGQYQAAYVPRKINIIPDTKSRIRNEMF